MGTSFSKETSWDILILPMKDKIKYKLEICNDS